MEEGIKVLGDNNPGIKPVTDNIVESKPVDSDGIKSVSVNQNVNTQVAGSNDDYIEGIPDWSIEPEVLIKR